MNDATAHKPILPSIPEFGRLKKMKLDGFQRLGGDLRLLVVPAMYASEIFVLVKDSGLATVAAVEQAVGAISTRLQEHGLLTEDALRSALDEAGIVTLTSQKVARVWDADRGGSNDTWKVYFPADARHSMRGAVLTVDPTPGREDIACALYADDLREYLFPTDRLYVLSTEEREARFASDAADNINSIYEQVPIGPVLLPRAQFGGVPSAFHRAFNLMTAAGYELEVID